MVGINLQQIRKMAQYRLFFIMICVFLNACQSKVPVDFVEGNQNGETFQKYCDSVKFRLQKVVDNRNYFFKETTKADANDYLNSKRSFKGLLEDEIIILEQKLHKKFPISFKTYLRNFGKNCGDLFYCGQNINYRDFVRYQKRAGELFENEGIKNINLDSILVFEFHQGYSFSYFNFDKNDNIKISRFAEMEKNPIVLHDNFQEMLESSVSKIEKNSIENKDSDGYFIIIKDGFTSMEYPAKSSGIIPKEIGDTLID